MAVKPLNERQLFRMKRDSLEKRITDYYAETQNVETVIEYGLAVLVRNAISMQDFSFVCQDLYREIFLTSEPSETLRNYCLYFYDFFEYSEWEIVRNRLFKKQSDFSELRRALQPITKYVRAATAPTFDDIDELLNYANRHSTKEPKRYTIEEKARYSFAFHVVFAEANGKRHKLTLNDANISMAGKRFYTLLEILTQLTIFEENGVNRYKEVVPTECQESVGYTVVEKGAQTDSLF